MTKVCSKCFFEKPLEEFVKNKGRPDGYGTWCKECMRNEYTRRRESIKRIQVCTICNQEKSESEFRFNPKFGVRTECKECEKTQLRCSKCGEVNLHEAFPSSEKSVTGRHSWCLDCHAEKQNNKYHNIPGEKEKHKADSRKPRAKAWRKRYNADLPEDKKYENRKKHNARTLERWHNDPIERIKHKARVYVWKAVKSGKLAKPEGCSKCGIVEPLQAHHLHGYWPKAVWLSIEWLCVPCHNEADIIERDSNNKWFTLEGNEALAPIADKIRLALNKLKLTEDEFLMMVLQCAGEDEMDTILNFIGWLDINENKETI